LEAKLSFDVEPGWHPIIAVDEGVVKCGGRPLYVWVAVDAYTRQPICLVLVSHSPGPWGTPSDSCGGLGGGVFVGDPVTLTDRGPWHREAVTRAGFPNHVHQTFGLRSSVERFRDTSKTGPEFSIITSTPRRHFSRHS